jgi:ABC-type multidrug transport system fused ATPase/permease subunit
LTRGRSVTRICFNFFFFHYHFYGTYRFFETAKVRNKDFLHRRVHWATLISAASAPVMFIIHFIIIIIVIIIIIIIIIVIIIIVVVVVVIFFLAGVGSGCDRNKKATMEGSW